MRTIILGIFILLLAIQPAFAVCGDVTGDNRVQATDALIVLKESTGISTGQCVVDDGVLNYLEFTNLVACWGSAFTATMDWSEHPTIGWSDWSGNFNADEGIKRIDDDYIGGTFTVDMGLCGVATLDLDTAGGYGIRIPTPTDNGVIEMTLEYDSWSEELYSVFRLIGWYCDSPQDCASKQVYEEPIRVSLGKIEGISSVE